MNIDRFITVLLLVLLAFSAEAKKVCIVNDRKDADVCVNITKNRAIADYVIVLSKKRYKTGSNIWIITDRKDAELKVYYSNIPEKCKVFISKNPVDEKSASK